MEFCITLLRENGYPLDLIFKTISTRVKTLLANKLKKIECNQDNTDNEISEKKIIVFPYIKNLSEKTAALIDRSNFTISLKCLNKLNNHINVHKDRTEHEYKNNVVYKIESNNCEATHVGQTKRHLKTRINEHKNNRRLDESRHSVITNHIMEFNHSFK